ncbi:MAG: hypothetical protein ABI894_18135, partial [Ilumatobacteraceae bacterium]
MRVTRDGGSMIGRRIEKTRIVALIATFLLLMGGFVVSAPGLMSASASGSDPSGVQGGDDRGDDHDGNDDEASNDDECENEDEAENEAGQQPVVLDETQGFAGGAEDGTNDDQGDDEGD